MRKTAVLLVALVLGAALLVLGLASSGRASNWLLGAIGLQPDVVALGNLAFGDTPETIQTKLAGTSFFSQQGSSGLPGYKIGDAQYMTTLMTVDGKLEAVRVWGHQSKDFDLGARRFDPKMQEQLELFKAHVVGSYGEPQRNHGLTSKARPYAPASGPWHLNLPSIVSINGTSSAKDDVAIFEWMLDGKIVSVVIGVADDKSVVYPAINVVRNASR